MTWRKTGTEFDDDCANVDLSDAAYRTHQEAIGFIYRIESDVCRIAKSAVRRFATSKDATDAIKELIGHGFWKDRDSHYEVVHHADVITESLHAQQGKRDRDRAAKQRQRSKQGKDSEDEPVSGDVSADSRQTDRQTDKQLGSPMKPTCDHGVETRYWKCTDCESEAV